MSDSAGGAAGAGDAWRAVEVLYHAYLTGLILFTVSRRGAGDAANLVFWTFRRQHLAKFLPGLEKLGLRGLPDAVACARYHYLSNFLGGVRVGYTEESARKAWIRYPPPRWIWQGPAICGIPSDVSRAMLRGWHAHNGVSLRNPRLGFVCTKQTVDGQPGLEGYYLEHDRDLAPEERLRFAPEEEAPAFDPAMAPRVPAEGWPAERLAKVRRNYSMDYIATILPEAVRLFGALEGGQLVAGAARLIGMQYYAETAALLGIAGDTPDAFAEYLVAMGRGQGDDTTWQRRDGEIVLHQTTWRLMADAGRVAPPVFDAWMELWRGAALAHDPRLRLDVIARRDLGDPRFEWRLCL
jgi:hypothetical protein